MTTIQSGPRQAKPVGLTAEEADARIGADYLTNPY